MARLMVISCSSKKSGDPGMVPAIERYQGTTYQVIKKARREGYWPQDIHLFIVSAKYGLISEHVLIEAYDLKMTEVRAGELQTQVGSAIDALFRATMYDQIFINTGSVYSQCLTASLELQKAYADRRVIEAHGQIGERLKQTKAWILAQH